MFLRGIGSRKKCLTSAVSSIVMFKIIFTKRIDSEVGRISHG